MLTSLLVACRGLLACLQIACCSGAACLLAWQRIVSSVQCFGDPPNYVKKTWSWQDYCGRHVILRTTSVKNASAEETQGRQQHWAGANKMLRCWTGQCPVCISTTHKCEASRVPTFSFVPSPLIQYYTITDPMSLIQLLVSNRLLILKSDWSQPGYTIYGMQVSFV